jgi:hypothetical protein
MNHNQLKYHKKWIEYDFINEPELQNQVTEFEKGEDPYSEHYRYKSFLNFVKKKKEFSDIEIANYIELVELDIDQAMASSALVKLFTSKKLNSSQLEDIGKKLKGYGKWAKKIVEENQIK